ncbi:MAG TPA: LPS-assembly protein LptD [Methyloversatilis sp.]
MLRRSVILYLAWMSGSALAAEALPQLKVDPSLVPPSRRPAKTVKGADAAVQAPQPTTEAAAIPDSGASDSSAPASAAIPTPAASSPVPVVVAPTQVPSAAEPAVPAAAAAPAAAPARAPAVVQTPKPVAAPAVAAPVEKPADRFGDAPPGSGNETFARGLPALKVDSALVKQPSAVARKSVPGQSQSAARSAVAAVDVPPTRSSEPFARGLPPLRVDRSLLGAPPVVRRRTEAPVVAGMPRGVPGGPAAPETDLVAVPPAFEEDDVSLMMYGKISLAQFVERNPDFDSTLIDADQISGVTDETMHAEGAAELRRPGTTLNADVIDYAIPGDELNARGNVRLVRKDDVIEGPSLRYQLSRGEGVFDKPRYTLRRNLQTGENLKTTTGTGQADSMEFLGESRVRMTNATYSTCEPGNRDWYAKAETLNLDFTSDDGGGSNGTVYFKDVPVLYSPWLDFSLNNKRSSGFLAPTFGTSNRTGIDFLLPYYWNIAPNMDATIAPRLLGTRGLMLSNEFRYLNENYHGIARFDYLYNDSTLDRERHALSIRHTQQITPQLTGVLNYNEVSDRAYFTDMGSRLSVTSTSYLAKEASLTYAGDWWTLTGRVLEYQSLANQSALYSQLPSLILNAYRGDMPAGMAFRMNSSFTSFQINDTKRDEGRRVVAYPQLALPMQTSYMTITPKIGVHMSAYDIDRGSNNAALPTSLSRAIPIFSLDTSTVFERDSDLFGRGYIQTLEPRVYYVLSSYKDQSKFPVFDSGQADFNFAQIFSENVFVGQDRISDSNQITTAAISRFVDPDNGAERARLALGQRFYFSDQRVTLPGGVQRTDRIASTLASVAGELLPKTWVDATVQYNPDQGKTERYNVSARYNSRPAQVFNASYRFRRPTPRVGEIRDVDFSAQWPLTNRWYGVARYNFSIAEERLVEGLGGLEYNGGCWVGRAVFQRIATNVQSSRTALFFQLELNDFSRIGSNPLDALKRSIPGYGQINQSVADPIFGDDF